MPFRLPRPDEVGQRTQVEHVPGPLQQKATVMLARIVVVEMGVNMFWLTWQAERQFASEHTNDSSVICLV